MNSVTASKNAGWVISILGVGIVLVAFVLLLLGHLQSLLALGVGLVITLIGYAIVRISTTLEGLVLKLDAEVRLRRRSDERPSQRV
ncbi:hypothetical protein JI721_06315 [Alicyclobacillus cycloheptanicus]|uniref:Uncharacterized protein n=1 Tax=Alicyclobacillus cycloheptanicus TaxID=1457 RepID=A0ABT9XMD0_9BACL|nr:hypothetical protein [Alicyclobacillus cycloheptanicus]MDQ0191285.1 hypothetical protein [Alicyclobacillus cycloheptanicus]WDM02406.1 hypothetical protein JI721_06315 [Alicyclobacillus cycloheptanicus]